MSKCGCPSKGYFWKVDFVSLVTWKTWVLYHKYLLTRLSTKELALLLKIFCFFIFVTKFASSVKTWAYVSHRSIIWRHPVPSNWNKIFRSLSDKFLLSVFWQSRMCSRFMKLFAYSPEFRATSQHVYRQITSHIYLGTYVKTLVLIYAIIHVTNVRRKPRNARCSIHLSSAIWSPGS